MLFSSCTHQTAAEALSSSRKNFFFVKAAGAKAERLTTNAEALHAAPQTMRDVLRQASQGRRDYAQEPGTQILCKLLSDLSTHSEIQKLSDKATVWQTNWTEVAWPTGDTLLKKDGSELWFQTSLRDLSGQVERVWMGQKAALSLSQLDDKDDFLEANSAGKQMFPIVSSVKVIRELREGQPPEGSGDVAQLATTKSVNLVIVEAHDQPLDEAPTKATLELIPMLQDLKDDTSAILPAGLHMVKVSPHYAFTVTCMAPVGGQTVQIPCQKILALVRSSKSTKTTPLGENGFKLITPGVEDLMSEQDPSGQAANEKHTLSVICTLDNMPTYRLDPPRGGSQHALVTITGKTADAWVAESVQLLSADAATKAKHSFQKLLHLAMHIYARDRKRALPWTDECCPVVAKKCSRPGRYPTDQNMPDP